MGKARKQVTFSARAERYARAVLSGEIPACKWVKAAACRHLDDLLDPGQYFYDAEEAERACQFAEFMPHIKGKWARSKETIKLEDWQCFVLCSIFGWKQNADGLRKYRTVYLEVARKNAKSTLLAVIALYLLALDGEAGAEVYSAATTRDQARIVFAAARAMALREPEFRARYGVTCSKDAVAVEDTSSALKALSADANTLDGLNPHGSIIDELHAHRTRAVWDVMETGTGARSQPLLVAITTAGSNRAGICYEIRSYLCAVLNDTLHRHGGLGYKVEGDTQVDDSFFGLIYTLDSDDDWTDESLWIKANPNLGVSVSLDDMQRLARKAMRLASAQPNFLTKRLDVWVNADSAWMDMLAWDRQAMPGGLWESPDTESAAEWAARIKALYPEWRCYMGLDLASKIDVASLACLLTNGEEWRLFTRHWLPEDTIEESDNSQYKGWASTGAIRTTDGNVIDHDAITDDIKEIAATFQPVAVAYDPGFDSLIPQQLANKHGLPMVAVRPTVLNFSEPMKTLESLIISSRLQHCGNPAMTWMISNVVCHRDAKDNIYPRKEREDNKIDGAVAAILALNQALAGSQTSNWDTPGYRPL